MEWKKVQDLKKQCYLPWDDRDGDNEYDMDKFAELIIRECAKVAFRAAPSDDSGCDISSAIEDHFGLE